MNKYNLAEKKSLLQELNNKIIADNIDVCSLNEYDKKFLVNANSEADVSFAALWLYEKELFKRLKNEELTVEQVKNIINKINENLGCFLIMFSIGNSENISSPYGEYSCMQKVKKQQKK